MIRILAFLVSVLAATSALAQSTLLQGGPWAPGHLPMYVGSGSGQAVVQDSGPAGGGSIGLGLSELGITARGTGTAPYANAGTGPFNTNACDFDGPATGPYHYLCWSPNATAGGVTGGQIVYGAANGAPALPLNFMLNGVSYPFPVVAIASNVGFTPSGGVSSTNVQNAIVELDTKKAAITSLANVAFSGASTDIISNQVAWTPVLTFATPGDLAVSYSVQFGRYVKLSSNMLLVQFSISTSAFTFTTASGTLQISGLPFTSQNTTSLVPRGGLSFTGINKATFSQIAVGIAPNTSLLILNASGMGVTATAVTAADTPTGGTVTLTGEVIIFL